MVYMLYLTSLLAAYTSSALPILLQVLLAAEAKPCSCKGVDCCILCLREWMDSVDALSSSAWEVKVNCVTCSYIIDAGTVLMNLQAKYDVPQRGSIVEPIIRPTAYRQRIS
jgi:hypothetical protein